jgi:aromatic-L-amino-acid decarboxylase
MPSPHVALNFSDNELEQAGRLLTELLQSYERSIPAPAVLPRLDRDVLSEILSEPFPDEGIGIERLFALIRKRVVPNSTAIAHPRFLAYVLGPPNGIAPFADAIASALNQNCNFWQLSPAASVIERKVIEWLSGLFAYPEAAGGILTSGGSMATLVALSAAIHDKFPGDFRKTGLQSSQAPLVVYTSEEAHRCVEKDAVILGLGLNNVRKIPVDPGYRMRVDLLQAAVREDRAAGKHPVCVVAAGGTINTGSIDPIDDLADFCSKEGLWLHVDGAFGALCVLSSRVRDQLLPCGRADSIALDPHKLLFAPLEAGCVIVRDREKLRRAFSYGASYLTVAQDPLFTNYMDYGPQLSRSFRAFKIWCSLQVFGVDAFVVAVEHTLEMARYLEERLLSEEAFELMAPVTLNAVCFRLRRVSDGGNERVLARIVDEGTALLGPVRLGQRTGIRACVTNYRTRREDIDLVVERLCQLGVSSDV